MNDLNTIARLNAEAVERDIPNQQAKGKYVVAEYHGLNFVGYSTHQTQADAHEKACEIGLEAGHRARVFDPTHAPAVLTVDGPVNQLDQAA